MDIKQENIDNLNAKLKIKIENKDYNETYEKSLKEYRKQVQLPGFRAGNVPTSVIKKKYGPSLLAQEIDRLLNEAISGHIKDNELNILGQPLPVDTNDTNIDWKNPGDFEFTYEMGIAPEFDLSLPGREKYAYHTIKVDDEMVNKQVDDFAKRYGKLGTADVAEDKDMLMCSFTELDEKDKEVEGGFVHSSTVSIEFIEDKKIQKKLIGMKVGDTLVVDPNKISRGEADLAAMLNIDKELAANYTKNVQMKVTEVKRLAPANVDQALFDKIYGEGNVTSEEEFRGKISGEMSSMFSKESDRLFKRDLSQKLLKKLKLDLPADFLKKWIMASQKEEVTMEQVEADFDNYSESLKWQLVENKIIKDNEIKVEFDEVLAHTKELLGQQYAQYGMMIPEEEELNKYAANVLQNQEEARRIYDALFEVKVMAFLKETVKISEKEVSYDDFVKLAQA